jgi:hypothetical protein
MSSPFWWGDWRPNLTPHTGNLQPTDLIECTMMSGAVPTNTVITGAQIIAAASGGSATWGGITGTLSAQTDLQSALDNKVPYTGATADVNLGSHDLTATQGTFATGGSSDTLTVNHTSGSGKAITITKGGAGEGIYVNKTSGSGNAVTIVGDLEATTIKKTSGTSTQFLKADGSVDTTTYQPTLVSGTNIKTVNGNSLVGSGNVSIGPKLLGFSGILGTNTTLNTVTICHSLLIPANTLGTNNILQLVFRMYRVSGAVGQLYGRIYFNTTNSLTGATLFNTIFTMNNIHQTGYVERNFSYNGTNLTSYLNAAYSEYTVGNIVNVPFNRSVDNYVIFTMQCQNGADVANINLFKVFAYV